MKANRTDDTLPAVHRAVATIADHRCPLVRVVLHTGVLAFGIVLVAEAGTVLTGLSTALTTIKRPAGIVSQLTDLAFLSC